MATKTLRARTALIRKSPGVIAWERMHAEHGCLLLDLARRQKNVKRQIDRIERTKRQNGNGNYAEKLNELYRKLADLLDREAAILAEML